MGTGSCRFESCLPDHSDFIGENMSDNSEQKRWVTTACRVLLKDLEDLVSAGDVSGADITNWIEAKRVELDALMGETDKPELVGGKS